MVVHVYCVTMNTLIYQPLILLHVACVWGAPQVVHMRQGNEHVQFGPNASPQCDVGSHNHRIDCQPGASLATQHICQDHGCCWDIPAPMLDRQTLNLTVDIGSPFCYFPKNYQGYVVTSSKETGFGYTAMLSRRTKSGWPNDVLELQLNVWMETESRLHFKIFDPKTRRYEVPISTPSVHTKALQTDYSVHIVQDPFGIRVTRKSTGATLFDSTISGAPLIFADQFLQVTSALDTELVYGLGEHLAPLLLNASKWQQLTAWARDAGPAVGENLYGTHPFYLGLEKDGQAHGVFLLNSNAMEFDLQPIPALTFRMTGGVLDFYIMTGPTVDAVVQQYAGVVGHTYMPPYWALGFHLCRYGYGSSVEMKKVIDRNRALNIPYDVQWNDIDYMDNHLDWTYDHDKYAGLPSIVNDLHSQGQKYVIIVDPGISNTREGNYPPYDQGIKEDIFIRNATGGLLVGAVWPGPTVFPDFTHPKAADWWYNSAQTYHNLVPFDGLWTDMNEPSNFVFGSTKGCTSNSLDVPPYVPYVNGGKLATQTVCPSAKQYLSTHYNLHNLYGLTEVRATHRALTKILGKRSIVITRSSYPTLGQYGGHWTGDIQSTWEHMYYTIPALINFNMFGIPLIGADICGFTGDTTEEMCIRWMQLGAFYPFMRNHNDLHSKDQDPAVFSHRARQIMRLALELRYSLLPYLYTLFHHSNDTGRPVVRALMFQYPTDKQTHAIDRQFMWGDGLLITPVLQPNVSKVAAYLPADRWYDIYEGMFVDSQGQYSILHAPLEKINVHVRGGVIIPLQQSAVTTTIARTLPFSLLVALDKAGHASGDLFWDDGESLGTVERGYYNYITFIATEGRLVSSIPKSGYMTSMTLGSMRILGVRTKPTRVTVNGKAVQFFYHEQQQEIMIEDLTQKLLQPLTVKWA